MPLPSDTRKKQPAAPQSRPRAGGLPSNARAPAPKPDPSWWDYAKDVAKSAPTALATGVAAIPGTLGDVEGLAARGGIWLGRKLGLGSTPEQRANVDAGLSNGSLRYNSYPGTADYMKQVERATGPLYQPKYAPAKRASAVLSAIPSAVVAAPKAAGTAIAKSIIPSLAAYEAGEAAQDTDYEPAAALAAGVLTNSAQSMGQAVRKIRSPQTRQANANRAAGLATQQSILGQDARTQAALALAARKPDIPNYRPTSGQVLNTPAARRFESDVAAINAKPGAASPLTEQANANLRAISEKATEPSIWQKHAPTPPAVANKGEASSALHGVLNEKHDAMLQNERAAWGKAFKSGVADENGLPENIPDNSPLVHAGPILDRVKSQIKGLTTQDERLLGGPSAVINDLDKQYGYGSGKPSDWSPEPGIASNYNPGYRPMPSAELQRVRSRILSMARGSADPSVSRALGDIAGSIEKELKSPSSYLENGQEAAADWTAANNATAQRYSLFGRDAPAGTFTTKDALGNFVKSPDTAIDAITSDPQKYLALRNHPLISDSERGMIDNATRDAKIADITQNGTVIPSSQKIESLAADQNIRTFAATHPDFADSLGELKNHAVQSEFADAATSGPDSLAKYLDAHKDDVKAVADPQAHGVIDDLHEAARQVAPPTRQPGVLEQATPNPALSAVDAGGVPLLVQNNPGLARFLRGTRKAASIAPIVAAGATGQAPLSVVGAKVIGSSLDRQYGSRLVDKAANFVLGDTQDLAKARLSEIEQNPELKAQVLGQDFSLPTPPPLAGSAAKWAARTALRNQGWQAANHSKEPETDPLKGLNIAPLGENGGDVGVTDPNEFHQDSEDFVTAPNDFQEPDRTPHAAGGATGARKHVNPLTAERLMKRLLGHVERARKDAKRETAQILHQDDASVAKALAIAGSKI